MAATKILVIGFTSIRHMPYLSPYLEALGKAGQSCDLLYWNRHEEESQKLASVDRVFRIDLPQDDGIRKTAKMRNFLEFRKRAISVLSEGQYDALIILSTIPAVLLAGKILRRYSGKYIFDYRDYTYERFKPYRWLVARISARSAITLSSSYGFNSIFPDKRLLVQIHNYSPGSLERRDLREPYSDDRIRLRFWGLIRHPALNAWLISALGGDPRFELHYHGRVDRSCAGLAGLARERGCANVFFHGVYDRLDRFSFFSRTDVIHNLYEHDGTMDLAMGNKLYDGAIHYIPQIVTRGSLMGDLAAKFGLGLEIEPFDGSLADKLYNWYRGIDAQDFRSCCDAFIAKISDEQAAAMNSIKGFVSGGWTIPVNDLPGREGGTCR